MLLLPRLYRKLGCDPYIIYNNSIYKAPYIPKIAQWRCTLKRQKTLNIKKKEKQNKAKTEEIYKTRQKLYKTTEGTIAKRQLQVAWLLTGTLKQRYWRSRETI